MKNIKNLYITIFSTAFVILICEISLGLINYSKHKNWEKKFAHVWKEILTTQNIEKYISPKNFLSLKINSQPIFPLTQTSNKRILVCNEHEWVTINTDRYGFNNLNRNI